MYEVPAEVRSTRDDDGAILLDLSRGKIFRLNGTGALIFEHVRQCESEAEIIESIGREFDVSLQVASMEVIEFLKSLERQGLVTNKRRNPDENPDR